MTIGFRTGKIDKIISGKNNFSCEVGERGGVTEIVNSSGTLVKSYKYDAFGNILQETGPTVPGGFTYTAKQQTHDPVELVS